jgi:hypothetical protein
MNGLYFLFSWLWQYYRVFADSFSRFVRVPLFQKRRNSVLRQVREFSGIEKRASAGRTFFELDVRLLWIDPSQHAAIAPGATVAVDFIRLPARQRIAGIYCCCRVLMTQPIAFSDIKPNPVAVLATIDFDALVLDGFHVVMAFRTNHRIIILLIASSTLACP